MDAMEFLSEAKRMCDHHTVPCEKCAANEFCGFTPEFPSAFGETTQMRKMVELVEKWSKEHPRKTRQDEFLERWPNGMLDNDGVVGICPRNVDNKYICNLEHSYDCHGCPKCRREFWMQEVE